MVSISCITDVHQPGQWADASVLSAASVSAGDSWLSGWRSASRWSHFSLWSRGGGCLYAGGERLCNVPQSLFDFVYSISCFCAFACVDVWMLLVLLEELQFSLCFCDFFFAFIFALISLFYSKINQIQDLGLKIRPLSFKQ